MLLNFCDAATICCGLFGLTRMALSLRALFKSESNVTWMFAMARLLYNGLQSSGQGRGCGRLLTFESGTSHELRAAIDRRMYDPVLCRILAAAALEREDDLRRAIAEEVDRRPDSVGRFEPEPHADVRGPAIGEIDVILAQDDAAILHGMNLVPADMQ